MPTIFSLASYINGDLLVILSLLLLTGAAAKSAQLGRIMKACYHLI
jgi:NADH:ubiquinone oxidoreductase subunit 5 (subunit L)/multisubunit Na+/H+ antiporter MnhA subunit